MKSISQTIQLTKSRNHNLPVFFRSATLCLSICLALVCSSAWADRITYNPASGVTATVSTDIADVSASNKVRLFKTGAGTLILTGVNTYTGRLMYGMVR